jgi:hypothetical protein
VRTFAYPVPDVDPDLDAQKDIIKEIGNTLTVAQDVLTTMNSKLEKNDGFPQFEGTYLDYPGFKRGWLDFQETYHAATLDSVLVDLFCHNCLEKELADVIRGMTMAVYWEKLDTFYDRPDWVATDGMAI